jgi:hypothetical protein
VIDDIRQRFITARRRLPAIYWTVWVGTLVNRLGGFVGPLYPLHEPRPSVGPREPAVWSA